MGLWIAGKPQEKSDAGKPAVWIVESIDVYPEHLYTEYELLAMGEGDFNCYFDYDWEDTHGSQDHQ